MTAGTAVALGGAEDTLAGGSGAVVTLGAVVAGVVVAGVEVMLAGSVGAGAVVFPAGACVSFPVWLPEG